MDKYILVLSISLVCVLGFIVRKGKSKSEVHVSGNDIVSAPKSYKIVSIVVGMCYVVITLLGVYYSANNTEDTTFIFLVFLLPSYLFAIYLSLWLNLKQVIFVGDTVVFRTQFGVKSRHTIGELSYLAGRENIRIYKNNKIIFKVNYLWMNVDMLLKKIPIKWDHN